MRYEGCVRSTPSPIRDQVRQALNPHAWRDKRLAAVADLVHTTMANSTWVSLEEAASVAHYCPGHFSTFFHKHVGVPFVLWQFALRMQRAEDLLVQKEWMPLGAVGAAVGYASPSTFAHAFKRYSGINARQLRRFIRACPAQAADLSEVERLDYAYGLAMRERTPAMVGQLRE